MNIENLRNQMLQEKDKVKKRILINRINSLLKQENYLIGLKQMEERNKGINRKNQLIIKEFNKFFNENL